MTESDDGSESGCGFMPLLLPMADQAAREGFRDNAMGSMPANCASVISGRNAPNAPGTVLRTAIA
jgi:hypothetical protein